MRATTNGLMTPISTVTRREQDLWVAFRRVVALPDSAVIPVDDADEDGISDAAFDDYVDGGEIPI